MWLTSAKKGAGWLRRPQLPDLLNNGQTAFLTVIARLVLNRSSECSEEAAKELDEAPLVYCPRSALYKQIAFGGPSTGSGRTEYWIFPFTGCWIFPFVVSPSASSGQALSNHRPPPEHDAIYATNFRVGTIESGLAMMLEIAIRCVT